MSKRKKLISKPVQEERAYVQQFSIQGGEPFLPGELSFSEAGIQVNEQTALRSSAVWSAIRTLSQLLASLDIRVFRRVEDACLLQRKHPMHNVLNVSPNDDMSGFTWKELMVLHTLAYGNGYSYIRKENGIASELLPLDPLMTTIKRIEGQIVYFTEVGGKPYRLTPDQVFHIIAFTWNGLMGMSPIRYATTQIGSALAMDRFSAKYFANNTVLSGVLKHPGKLSDVARKNLRDSFNLVHQGSEQSFKMAILEEGLEWNPLTVDVEKTQLLEGKLWAVRDVARIFGLPPHLLGDLEHSWATIAEENENLVKYHLRFWFKKIEAEANRKLLTEREKSQGYYFHFDVDDLLRGQTKERYESYNIGRQGGWLSVNDIHEKEGLAPVPGGDAYYAPLNMEKITAEQKEERFTGPEMTATLGIIQAVVAGQLPRDSAIALLTKVLGEADDTEAEKLLGSAGKEPVKDVEPVPEPETDKETHSEPEKGEFESKTLPPEPKQEAKQEPENRQINVLSALGDILRRINTKETKAIKRACKKYLPDEPQGFADWSKEFFTDHETLIRQTLGTILNESDVDKYVTKHIETSHYELTRTNNEPEAVNALLDVWSVVRDSDELKFMEEMCLTR